MLPRRDIEVVTVYCPNPDCPGQLNDHYVRPELTDAVGIYRESGMSELLDEMPECPSCGTEMVFFDELQQRSRTCSN